METDSVYICCVFVNGKETGTATSVPEFDGRIPGAAHQNPGELRVKGKCSHIVSMAF